jgi:hypothetical protein
MEDLFLRQLSANSSSCIFKAGGFINTKLLNFVIHFLFATGFDHIFSAFCVNIQVLTNPLVEVIIYINLLPLECSISNPHAPHALSHTLFNIIVKHILQRGESLCINLWHIASKILPHVQFSSLFCTCQNPSTLLGPFFFLFAKKFSNPNFFIRNVNCS